MDSHLEDLTGVKGVQRGEGSHRVVVAICLVVALGVYAHFVWEVVGDICEFYDIKSVSLLLLSCLLLPVLPPLTFACLWVESVV